MVRESTNTITVQSIAGLIYRFSALAIDNNRRTSPLTQELYKFLIRSSLLLTHFIEKIGTIKTGDMNMRIAQSKLRQDIQAHSFGRSRGKRKHRGLQITIAQQSQLPVFRAKIMAPFADTMRLIDRQQRQAHTHLHFIQQQ